MGKYHELYRYYLDRYKVLKGGELCDAKLSHGIDDVIQKNDVVLYVKKGCPFCKKAVQLTKKPGMQSPHVVTMESGDVLWETLKCRFRQETVPYVFIGGEFIGGSDDLETYVETRL